MMIEVCGCGSCEFCEAVPEKKFPPVDFYELYLLEHAALEAAQDEIEARILASERDRELIRQLGVVVDHMAPAAYKAIMAAGGVV